MNVILYGADKIDETAEKLSFIRPHFKYINFVKAKEHKYCIFTRFYLFSFGNDVQGF